MNLNKKIIYPSLFLTLCFVGTYNPLSNLEIKSFNRAIGNGVLNGIDISTRINNFYFWFIILTPLIFYVCYYLVRYTYTNNKNEKAFDFLYTLSCTGFIALTLYFITKFTNEKNLFSNFSITIILIMILLILIFLNLNKYLHIDFLVFKYSLILALALLFPLYTLTAFNFNFLFILNTIIITLVCSRLDIKKLQLSALPLAYGGFIISIFLEFINILNQYNIFINRFTMYIISYTILTLITVLIYIKSKNKKFEWEKTYYTALILSFSFIMVQPELQSFIKYNDLFEISNHGLAISELFNYGKIPLIETFDAHMFQNSLWGIIYGILNNDIFGAMFAVYDVYIVPIRLLILYKILSLCFDNDFSFFTIILFPVSLPIFWSDISLISVLALIFAVKVNKPYSYLVYWFSLVVICLYRLDTGFAFSMATLVAYIILYLLDSKRLKLKYFIISFLSVIISCLAIYILICFIKNINPISRMLEFLSIAMSNINWAYKDIGDTNSVAFVFCYCIIPFMVLGIIIFILHQLKIYKSNILIIMLCLALSYFFNLSRALVRHSLVEMSFGIVLFCAIILIAITGYYVNNKKELFIFVFLGLTLFVNNLKTDNVLDTNTVLDASLDKYIQIDLKNNVKQKIQRVVFDDSDYKEVINAINKVLDNDETYIDFTNQSLLYALSGKEKPVYINQSPGLLSGEYSQNKFIEQIKDNSKIKIALMPANNKWLFQNLDGIANCYRYYKVAEYIYSNFYPAFEAGNYSFWYRGNKNDYKYGSLELHTYNLAQIPYIWGMYDNKKAYLNKEIEIIANGEYYTFDDSIDKTKGNYIMIEVTSDIDSKCSISFGNLSNDKFEKFNEFNFDLNKGNNRYLIRVSTDYYWYSNINSFTVETDINNIKVSLLEGD